MVMSRWPHGKLKAYLKHSTEVPSSRIKVSTVHAEIRGIEKHGLLLVGFSASASLVTRKLASR